MPVCGGFRSGRGDRQKRRGSHGGRILGVPVKRSIEGCRRGNYHRQSGRTDAVRMKQGKEIKGG